MTSSIELRFALHDARLVRLYGGLDLREHIGMLLRDVPFFARVETELKQERRIVQVRHWLVVTGLGFEMCFPQSQAAGVKMLATVVEEGALGERLPMKEVMRDVDTIKRRVFGKRRIA